MKLKKITSIVLVALLLLTPTLQAEGAMALRGATTSNPYGFTAPDYTFISHDWGVTHYFTSKDAVNDFLYEYRRNSDNIKIISALFGIIEPYANIGVLVGMGMDEIARDLEYYSNKYNGYVKLSITYEGNYSIARN